jgi:hypothetical protein
MFAIVGASTTGKQVGSVHAGCVIYDEHGSGTFENVVELNDKNGSVDFHVPQWVTR